MAIFNGPRIDNHLRETGARRAIVGPFHGTLAASQTDTQLTFGAAATHEFVAMRAGSVIGFSAQLSAAITGASTTVTPVVAINGTPVAATALSFTQAGAEVTAQATVSPGSATFSAGDLISVEYDSTGISNTPTITACLEIES